MEPSKILELIRDFVVGGVDRKKLLAGIMIVIISLAVLVCYEGFTASFTLSRLQKSEEVLSKLQELSSQIKTDSDPELIKAYKILKTQVTETIEQPLLPTNIMGSLTDLAGKDFAVKFLAGSAVVWIVWLVVILRILNTDKPPQLEIRFWNASRVFVKCGLTYGFCAIWLPKVFWFHAWLLFHICVYPLLLTIVFGLISCLFIKPEIDLVTNPDPK